MAATDPGPRDHLITRSLERDLGDLAAEVREEKALDAADAPERLARHAMDELRRELTSSESADEQAMRLNEVLRQVAGERSPSTPRWPCRHACCEASRRDRH